MGIFYKMDNVMNTFQPKIIFFDIDDTLYIKDEARIPESAKQALRELKQRGIITAIATGRTIAVLPEKIRKLIAECGIEMIVSINGQYVQFRGEKLVDFAMNADDVAQLSADLSDLGISHAFAAREVMSVAKSDEALLAVVKQMGLPYVEDARLYEHSAVYQFLAFYTASREAEVLQILPKYMKTVRWHERGVDLLDGQGSKARGIQAALDALNLTMADAMAFGDGLNDMEMLQAVGCGVAMGNAVPELQVVADYVAPRIEDDGIYRALVDLGVIE